SIFTPRIDAKNSDGRSIAPRLLTKQVRASLSHGRWLDSTPPAFLPDPYGDLKGSTPHHLGPVTGPWGLRLSPSHLLLACRCDIAETDRGQPSAILCGQCG
ncbi:unnamed protein product, partial [Mycena citricolor]